MNGSTDVLRPARRGISGRLGQWAVAKAPLAFSLLRRAWPIAHFGNTYVVTRYDDVREVLLTDADFVVPYKEKLDVIMAGAPFFLGMEDSPEYRRDVDAMRLVITREDIEAVLIPRTLTMTERAVADAGSQIDVVELVRGVTREVLGTYLGVSAPAGQDLNVWATRLFEFQFADAGNDPLLRREVDEIAAGLRVHIDSLLAARGGDSLEGQDDVLTRCLRLQRAGREGFTNSQIRSALIGFIVGGLPQPPMVVPHALEQLLRRPEALARATWAARAEDDDLLRRSVLEALRFDPLGPALLRKAKNAHTIAEGTNRAVRIPAGATVIVAFGSAMMDARRVVAPRRFDAARPASDYIHFGYGLHTCFGLHINLALLPLMLKPLLRRQNLRRVPGPSGRLSKRGVFAERLCVRWERE